MRITRRLYSFWLSLFLSFCMIIAIVAMPVQSQKARVIFLDDFEDPNLNTDLWVTKFATSGKRWYDPGPNNSNWREGNWVVPDTNIGNGYVFYKGEKYPKEPYGRLEESNSVVSVSFSERAVTNTFPFVYTKHSPFPNTGDFTLEMRVKVNQIGPWGTGIFVADESCGNPVSGESPHMGGILQFWPDYTERALQCWLHIHGTKTWLGEESVYDWHVYTLRYQNGSYQLFVDGSPALGPYFSERRPTVIWFANPVWVYDEGIWPHGWARATTFSIDYIKVLAPNQHPDAVFIWHVVSSTGARVYVEPRIDDRIQFDASDSNDPDGQITEYAWDWNNDDALDETTPEPMIEHQFQVAGEHAITLRVTDDQGASDKTTKTITVAQPQPPEASFIASPSSPLILDEVHFTDHSSDPDGEVVSWHWAFGDGTTSTEQNPVHRYEWEGTFTVTLTVTDNDNLTDETTQAILVEHSDLIQADFTFHVVDRSLHKIHLDATASIDTMGTIVRYEWDWDGDGIYDTAVQVAEMTHRFDGEGPYQVILTIVDDQGNRASCTKEVGA